MSWVSKIVGHRRVPASELMANPWNHRTHPEKQRRVVAASIEELGFVKSVLWNEVTGHIVDGHERVSQALSVGPDTLVDIEVVRLTPEEERKALLLLDASSELAEVDALQLDSLVADCSFDLDALNDLASEMLADVRPPAPEEAPARRGEVFDPLGLLSAPLEVVPSTVISTRDGYWQDRKRAWMSVGIRSEAGRGVTREELAPEDVRKTTGGLLIQSWTGHPLFYKQKQAVEKRLGRKLSTADFQENYFVIPDDVLASGTSVFDPVLCEALYSWFCHPGGVVLDPFAGGSVRGVVAALMGRRYFGCDLRAEQVEANVAQWGGLLSREVIGRPGVAAVPPVWRAADSKTIASVYRGVEADLVFSCPPYADLEKYSDDPADLSNMEYADFVAAYREIVARSCSLLREDRFAVFVVGEVRGPSGAYLNFVGDTVRAFLDAGLRLHCEAALVTQIGSLAVRVGRQFEAGRKLGKTHQNVLVFVKGSAAEAARAAGGVLQTSE